MLAEDIDLDRLVWDQAYRHDVMDLLRAETGAFGLNPPKPTAGTRLATESPLSPDRPAPLLERQAIRRAS